MPPLFRRLAFTLLAPLALFAQDLSPGIPSDLDAKNASTVWVNTPKPNSLPPGVTHHIFSSKAFGHDIGYCIYLPPGYAETPTARYSVIYNLHGAGGNEIHAMLAAEVLHEGILAKRWPPMIIVFPNGGKSTFYKNSADGKYPAETLIIDELIPHIDATYRTIARREGRAIEGFSMGGRGATRLALKYPQLFCSLFNQAGNVLRLADLYDPAQPTRYPNSYLGPHRQTPLDNDPFLLLQKNHAAIKSGLKIQIACGTTDNGHIKSIREFHQALLDAKIDHTYLEIAALEHQHDEMIRRYREIWFNHHAKTLRPPSL